MPGRRVDDGDVVVADPVERLGEQPVGGRLDEVDPLEDLVLGVLDPVGRAGLRVGVDQGGRRRLAAARAARYTEVVVLPTPPLSAATTTITGGKLGDPRGSAPGAHPASLGRPAHPFDPAPGTRTTPRQ